MSYVNVTMPCISLKHLGRYAAWWLDRDDCPIRVVKHDAGYFIAGCTEETLPKALENIFDWAADKAPFGWIMLDVDGDVQPDLEVY